MDTNKAGEVRIEAATPADGPAIAALLRDAGLPHEDFAGHVGNFIVARSGEKIVGAVGAEVYGEAALLRSLVVAAERRGGGLGGKLVEDLERAAGAWGVQRWWLLTTTAVKFFAQRGFRVAVRENAPAAIRATAEFRGLCPSVAVCMARERRAT